MVEVRMIGIGSSAVFAPLGGGEVGMWSTTAPCVAIGHTVLVLAYTIIFACHNVPFEQGFDVGIILLQNLVHINY